VDPTTAQAFAAARERIAANPLGFLALTLRSYRLLWTFFAASHPYRIAGIDEFISAHRPLPFETLTPELTERISGDQSALIVQPLFLTIGLVTLCLALVGLLCLVWRYPLPSPVLLAVALSLGIHGATLLTALTALGLNRYTIGLWPLIGCALFFASWWLFERWSPSAWRTWLREH
jgi:hypothetical protein